MAVLVEGISVIVRKVRIDDIYPDRWEISWRVCVFSFIPPFSIFVIRFIISKIKFPTIQNFRST